MEYPANMKDKDLKVKKTLIFIKTGFLLLFSNFSLFPDPHHYKGGNI